MDSIKRWKADEVIAGSEVRDQSHTGAKAVVDVTSFHLKKNQTKKTSLNSISSVSRVESWRNKDVKLVGKITARQVWMASGGRSSAASAQAPGPP